MSDDTLLGRVEKTARDVGKIVGDTVTGASGEEQFLLPSELKNVLAVSMEEMHYPLDDEPGRLRDYSNQWHRFYKARVKNGFLAFLYARNNILKSSTHGNDFAWIGTLFSQNSAKGIYIFSDSSSVAPAYETLAESWQDSLGFTRARFFHHDYETQLIFGEPASRRDDLRDWLHLDKYQPTVQSSEQIQFKNLVDNHNHRRKRIEEIIINKAKATPGLTPQEYLQDLIERTNWPEDRKNEFPGTWKGNLPYDVRQLVKVALSQKENPKYSQYTMIGGLLEVLIQDVDGEAQKELFEIIQDFELITDKDVVEEIQKMVNGG